MNIDDVTVVKVEITFSTGISRYLVGDDAERWTRLVSNMLTWLYPLTRTFFESGKLAWMECQADGTERKL